MKNSLIFSFLFFIATCKGQMHSAQQLSNTDYDVINQFLLSTEKFSFLDKEIDANKELLDDFEGVYQYMQNFYSNTNEQCTTGKDLELIKMACPLADKFKKYHGLLASEDFANFKKKHNDSQTIMEIDFSKIDGQFSQQHSKGFYNSSNDIAQSNEFPSIQIHYILYSKNKEIATIVYQIIQSHDTSYSDYFMLQKQDNVWWKSLGNLTL